MSRGLTPSKQSKYNQKDMFQACFEKVEGEIDMYVCKYCSEGLAEEKKKKYHYVQGSGYTNPGKHIERAHASILICCYGSEN